MSAIRTDDMKPWQELSMKAIEVLPDRFQARAETYPLVKQRYADDMLAQRKAGVYLFPPAVVARLPDGRQVLVDGHTRHGAIRKLGWKTIRAVVIDMTEEEAILHAIRTNITDATRAQEVKEDDRIHSVEIMLRNPELNTYSDNAISKTCGVGGSTVARIRLRLRDDEGLPLPTRVQKLSKAGKPTGKTAPYKTLSCGKPAISRHSDGNLTARIAGKNHYLGRDPAKAVVKRDMTHADRTAAKTAMKHASCFGRWLANRTVNGSSLFCGKFQLGGIRIGDVYLTPCDGETRTLLSEVGRCLMAYKALPWVTRAIVARYPQQSYGQGLPAELANPPFPIEFMTPEEVVAEFGSKDGGDSE